MDPGDPVEEIACWKKEKVLGAGGFGYVVLWRNKETNETIALKQCRWGHDSMMTPKHRSRWKLEVDMMSRLDHPNVVKAIPVPPELDVPATELPLLAMEYCSSGDLRKLLNKPENCCGLREKHVRLLLRHISSAVNYLHSMRIIHRDLKPENIVIQDINGTVIYKLIDLGYAKELDQGSLCTSFVGTLQYLAPELFMSQKYSCTVDYWSLGLVTHEIITGLRPFLPDKSPAEWIPIIKQKSSNQIRAFLDDDKNIVFSNEVSPFHHICSVLKKDIESWLQIMLEWDPKKRGRCKNGTAFSILEKALDKKVVLVFCVDTFRMLSFEIDKTLSLEDFEKMLETESGIPVMSQEILLPKGHVPNPDIGAHQFVSNLEEEEFIVFLFDKRDMPITTTSNIIIPPIVENMMRNPRTEMKYQEQRTSWAQAVYLSHQENTLANRLIHAFKANLMHLLTKTSYTHKNTSRMTAEMNKLLSKCSFFQKSLEQDIQSYEKQVATGGFSSSKVVESWKNSFENLKNIELLKQKISLLEESSARISSYTIDLQRSVYVRSKYNSPLEDTHQKILDAFADLRRRSKEQRQVPHDNTDIVRLLCLCLQQRHAQIQDIMFHIRKVNQVKRETEDIVPQIMNLNKEIMEWDSQVDIWQFRRQEELWRVIDALNDRIRVMGRSSSPLLSSSPQSVTLQRPIFSRFSPDSSLGHLSESSVSQLSLRNSSPIISPPVRQSRLEALSVNTTFHGENDTFEKRKYSPCLSSFSSAMSLTTLLEKTSEDSRRIKKENETLVESFQNMMERLKSCQETDATIVASSEKILDSDIQENSRL